MNQQVEQIPESLWRRLRSEPERAPELIALYAADRFAPRAAEWTTYMRAHHEPQKIARIARKKHVRMSGLGGAVLGIGGAVTAAADIAALAWVQSRMVFYIAGAYGFDPAHPMRPAELLALQELYDTPAEARAALDGIGTPLAVRMVTAGSDQPVSGRLVRFVGRKVAKRMALRLIPLVASPVNAVQNSRATAQLGARAVRFYGGDQARP